ncbi:SoxR reducing system RseC family protein [Anaerococcus prevotii]|uniref:SoxR reducing system RseC family protein n=1 Tax=Anaerococcus prevotii TaxID=33034 RepID=UPI002805A36F|nr:SoxR reducing system RseC family protein [Anaerococcus prevotii]MDU2558838.1 SoxR reducing system RseC family protein [Anaerococcus prevotii]MDU3136324.1 SoxR reducing system RseC family protein [Anaerococcus prevotii]
MDTVRKEGIVIDNNKGNLKVQIFRNGACGACAAKGSCAEKKTTEIELFSHEDLKKGDRVIIEGSSSEVSKLTATVYIVPVAMMLVGALIPNIFLKNTTMDINLLTLLSVVIFFAISMIFIKKLDKNVKNKNMMRVRKA